MNQNQLLFRLFSPPFFFLLFFLTAIFFLLAEPALSIDEFFRTCVPENCGKGPNISYPFWISGKQPPHCGFPTFQLSCKNDEPILNTSGTEFLIREFSLEKNTVYVVNTGWIGKPCPYAASNFTFSSTPFPFAINEANLNLLFFFNCTGSFPQEQELNFFPVSCFSNHTFAVLNTNGSLNHLNLPTNTCMPPISVPVARENSTPNHGYKELLEKGFLLNYTAPNCSLCMESGGQCGYNQTTSTFACFCEDRPHRGSCDGRPVTVNYNKKKKKIIIGVSTGVGSILLCSFAFLFFLYYRKKHNLSTSSSLLNRAISLDPSLKADLEKSFPTQIFDYKDLEEATNNFDSSKELGDGGFGTVYHGILQDGRNVAVKRLYENNYKRVEQFRNEIIILSRLRHQNLVTLYGFSSRHRRELLLVYEFIPNGTVADHLHGDRAKPGALTLSTRMSIAIESADALKYLHAVDIIHRDVKTNNILLDENFHVKVADFGLSRLFPSDATHVSTAPQGTPGYVDPEYHRCYQLTDRSDVYSFGVVLIELISSMPAVDISRHRHEINLAYMAINKIHNHALNELVDPTLGFDSDGEVRRMITQVAEVAFTCLQDERDLRPSMGEVLESLRAIVSGEYKVEKVEEIDTPTDVEVLLKKMLPLSPDTVTEAWESRKTTPNTSG